MASRLEELRAKAEAAEASAKARALTDDEAAEASFNDRIEAAAADAAAADKTRRANDLRARADAAGIKSGGAYLVEGIDLVALFPLGKSPPAGQLPGSGVIIVRSPPPDAAHTFNRELEAKAKPLATLFAVLLCASTVDPDMDSAEGIKLSELCAHYPDLSINAGDIAKKLGGAKSAADKRGRG